MEAALFHMHAGEEATVVGSAAGLDLRDMVSPLHYEKRVPSYQLGLLRMLQHVYVGADKQDKRPAATGQLLPSDTCSHVTRVVVRTL
jgi:hypothetical protein